MTWRGNDDNYAVFCYLSNNQLHVNTFLVEVTKKQRVWFFLTEPTVLI